MDIDFSPIVSALREIGYSGYFTLEADRHFETYSEDNISEGMKELAAAAKRLAEMYENAECRMQNERQHHTR